MRFVQDASMDGGVAPIQVEPEDIERLVRVAQQFGLDFDDAYRMWLARNTSASFPAPWSVHPPMMNR